jgi:hypothetical protein
MTVLAALGCQSERKHVGPTERPDKPSNPLPDSASTILRLFREAPNDNACYHLAETFYTQKGRWPTNFIELWLFPRPPGLAFDPSRYEEVAFTNKADGRLEIHYKHRDRAPGEDWGFLWVTPPEESRKAK